MPSNSPTLIEVKDIRAIAITKLAEEATLDGFDFLQRMIDEWGNGLNTFSKPDEKLWALDGKIVG